MQLKFEFCHDMRKTQLCKVKQTRDVGHPVVSYVNNANNITNENPSTSQFIKINQKSSNMFRLHTIT
jgi:hypothetical protein